MAFKDIPVRFFIYDEEADEPDLKEVDEEEFLAYDAPISYERNTVFANGVSQICLTKMPKC